MGVEHTIYCDECSTILVSASSVTEARQEGKTSGLVKRHGDKDLCASSCYSIVMAREARAITAEPSEGNNS